MGSVCHTAFNMLLRWSGVVWILCAVVLTEASQQKADPCGKLSCQHTCEVEKGVATCSCNEGFTLAQNGRSCEDVDECSSTVSPPPCSQTCQNTPGGYVCSCDTEHFHLVNNSTCKAKGERPKLIYASYREIIIKIINSTLSPTKITVPYFFAHHLSYAPFGHHVYWVDKNGGQETVFRRGIYDTFGTPEKVVSVSGDVNGITMDWINTNLYMAKGKLLSVCGASPFKCKTLWNSSEIIVAVAVNPRDREVYWIEQGKHIMKCSSACGLDGSSPQFVASDDMDHPVALTIDRPTKTVYWADVNKKVIERSSVDGHNKLRKVVLGLTESPMSVAVFEDILYWADGRAIHAADKFTGRRQADPIQTPSGSLWEVDSGMFMPHEIIVAHSSIQTQKVSPCIFAQCSHLCIPSNIKEYACACDDQSELMPDGITCQMTRTSPHLLLTTGEDIYQINTDTFHSPVLLASAGKLGVFDLLVHDPVSDVIITYESKNKTIYEVKPSNQSENWEIFSGSSVGGMAVDEENGNVYWTVSSEGRVMASPILKPKQPITTAHMFQIPTAIAIASKEGLLFVADMDCNCIFRMPLDGGQVTKIVSEVFPGSMVAATNADPPVLMWADILSESIRSVEFDGSHLTLVKPFIESDSELLLVGETLYWLPTNASYMYSADNFGHGIVNIINIDPYIADSGVVHHMALMNPPKMSDNVCRSRPDACDYFCTSSKGEVKCLCPNGMYLKEDGKTCVLSTCQYGSFRCDNKCLANWHKCNGKKDCEDGSDEADCTEQPKQCLSHEFKCKSNQCVPQGWRCDGQPDCQDGSDEEGCPPCPKGNWKCKSQSKCILESWLCDGGEDCGDGSDEAPEQCRDEKCDKNQFKCDHGGCIEMSERCDGFDDCVDKSDEKNCLSQCKNLQVSCNDGTCIPRVYQCDGEKDCPDGEDERPPVCPTQTIQNCTCPLSNWFTCEENPSICLPSAKRCNGIADCPGGTDERHCPTYCPYGLDSQWCIQLCTEFNFPFCHRTQEISWRPVSCDQHSWQCTRSKSCIPLSKTCDGKPDCPLGEDEGERCDSACYKNGGCEYRCKATSFGPRCSCHAGYILGKDGRSCVDHDECNSAEGYCSQMCIKKGGGLPMCKCGEGYKLESDRRTCKAMGERGKLLFAVGNTIRMLNLADHNLEVFVTSNKEIKGVGYDSKKFSVYWTEVSCKVTTVKRKRFYDGVVELWDKPVLALQGESTSMSYDWVNQNIYISREVSPDYVITICSMTTLQCSDIVGAYGGGVISSVIVDPANKKLFWIESVLDGFLGGESKRLIRSSRLDGADVKTLKETPHAKGLAVDHVLSKIYWSDATLQAILAMDYDGNRTRLVLTARHGLTHPHALAVFEDYVYFSNMDNMGDEAVSPCIENSNITVCNKFTAAGCKNMHRHHSGAESFAITNQVLQPNVKSPCAEEKCNGICVPLGGTSTCIQGMLNRMDGPCDVTQMEPQDLNDETTNGESAAASQPESQPPNDSPSSGGLAAGIIVPILLLLLIGAGFYYMRSQKKSEFCKSPHRIPFKGLDSILIEEDELQKQHDEVEDNDSKDHNKPTTQTSKSISWAINKGGRTRLEEEL